MKYIPLLPSSHSPLCVTAGVSHHVAVAIREQEKGRSPSRGQKRGIAGKHDEPRPGRAAVCLCASDSRYRPVRQCGVYCKGLSPILSAPLCDDDDDHRMR